MASPSRSTNPFHSKLLIVGTSALLIAMAYAGACNPFQRAVVRQLVDQTERLCGDSQTPQECLLKLQLANAEPSASPSADPGGMPPRLMSTSQPAVVAP